MVNLKRLLIELDTPIAAGGSTQELYGVCTAVPAMAWWHMAVRMAKWPSSRNPCCRTVGSAEPTRLLQVRFQAGLTAVLLPVWYCKAKSPLQKCLQLVVPMLAASWRNGTCGVCMCHFCWATGLLFLSKKSCTSLGDAGPCSKQALR